MDVNMNAAYRPSEHVVVRKIEGEILIVPVSAGVGESDDDLYSLNETGKDVWALLDGTMCIKDVVARLSQQYDAPVSEIETDIRDLIADLLRRRILV
ncbi:MAG: PqqD family protein [Desulfobacterales bacterium]|jgi:hypothetical protein|nr:PqqD family protein [Desulfobacterales bacterium]